MPIVSTKEKFVPSGVPYSSHFPSCQSANRGPKLQHVNLWAKTHLKHTHIGPILQQQQIWARIIGIVDLSS